MQRAIARVRPVGSKVPEVSVYFWTIKLLTTAMGESISDYAVNHVNPCLAVVAGAIGLLAALGLQFSIRQYVPWVYWLAVVMVAIFGTMAADAAHIELGIPYLVSAAIFSVALAVIFSIWYASEHTLSFHSITTTRREFFYWATVVVTFALGTATGDLTAGTMGLGYLASGVLFSVLILLPLFGYRSGRLNAIAAFWIAYILTRPLGASVADWFGKSRNFGALGVGDGPVSLVLAILIIALVGYLSVRRMDVGIIESQRPSGSRHDLATRSRPDVSVPTQPSVSPHMQLNGAGCHSRVAANLRDISIVGTRSATTERGGSHSETAGRAPTVRRGGANQEDCRPRGTTPPPQRDAFASPG